MGVNPNPHGLFLANSTEGGGLKGPPPVHALGGQIFQKKTTHTQISYKYRLT